MSQADLRAALDAGEVSVADLLAMAAGESAAGLLTVEIYGRQSHGKKVSIAQQLEIGQRRAEGRWEVYTVRRDYVSASRLSRKARDEWPQLLDDVRNKRVQVVWLWECSRGSRDVVEWTEFLRLCRDSRVRIWIEDGYGRLFDLDNWRDFETLATEGIASQRHSEETKARVQRQILPNAREGRAHGPVPFGYVRTYSVASDGTRSSSQSVDGILGPVVAGMFEDFRSGHSLKRIVRGLEEAGIQPPKGRWRVDYHEDEDPRRHSRHFRDEEEAREFAAGHGGTVAVVGWTACKVRVILRSPAYIGKRLHIPGRVKHPARPYAEGTLYDAQWPPLVGEDVFWAVQRRLDEPGRRTARRSGRAVHLLSSIALCGVCDAPLTVTYRFSKDRTPAYCCRDHSGVKADRDSMDQIVENRLLAAYRVEKNLARLRARVVTDDRDVIAARAEVDKIAVALEDLRQQLRARRITPSEFADAKEAYVADLAAANARLDAVEAPTALADFANGPAEELAYRWARTPLEAKREVLAALVKVRLDRRPGGDLDPGGRTEVTFRKANH